MNLEQFKANFTAGKKSIRREKTKPQTALVCGFEVCSYVLNFIVIGQYTIDLPESKQSVPGFLNFTAKRFQLTLIFQ